MAHFQTHRNGLATHTSVRVSHPPPQRFEASSTSVEIVVTPLTTISSRVAASFNVS